MPELAQLKSQRSTTKGSITKIKNYVEAKGSSLSMAELECRLGILESYFKQALSFQTSIEELTQDDDSASEARSRGELEELYCEAKSRLLTLLSGHRKSSSFLEFSNRGTPLSVDRLPKLKLPTFSGKYSEFQNFMGSFTKLVDRNESLSDIEKFNHLISCLSGAALRTVEGFEVTDANYSKALKHLKGRYDNKYLMFQEHIVELFNLPKVSKNSASQLRYLVDSASSHLDALESLGSYNDITNALIIYLVSGKLDQDSQSKWEESRELSKLPTWKECAEILNKRCQCLEAREIKAEQISESSAVQSSRTSNALKGKRGNSNPTSLAVSQSLCTFCKESGHHIYRCPQFLGLAVLNRFEQVKKRALCLNCLSKGHSVRKCSAQKCRVCSMPHHTLLHRYTTSSPSPTPSAASKEATNASNQNAGQDSPIANGANNSPSSSFVTRDQIQSQVFLATANVEIKDHAGQFHLARALLDSASQLNFISENLAQSLKLKKSKGEVTISGIGDVACKVRGHTQTVVKSRLSGFETSLSLYVLPHITGLQPERKIRVEEWDIPANVQLADPQFYKPQRVDLLIGADTFFQLLSIGQIKLKANLPTLQKTVFGWVVSGRVATPAPSPSALVSRASSERNVEECPSEDISLNKLVERFWAEEAVERAAPTGNPEQIQCESIFKQSCCRLPDGHFMVKLPFRDSPQQLANSLDIARRRFYNLERKLSKDLELRCKYSQFLEEYLVAGHMELIRMEDVPQLHYFMPHHCVLRPESSTTKLRVVFDASCRTTSNKSLNDLLMVGPTIQEDLFSILCRFRCYRWALTADITAMYRQVWVYPEDRNFQLILWREDPKDELAVYRLKTVTYGTASAPFLATRCLKALAEDHASSSPKAAKIVKRDFYMDDLLTGADSCEELYEIRREVESILGSAQFRLRKWYSNDMELLSAIPEAEREKTLKVNDSEVIKTLGLIWEPTADEFRFQYRPQSTTSSKTTKRSILSDIARLFDPLGLINPVVVRAKIFLQELWLLNLHWDESLPQNLEYRWCQFKGQLERLNHLKIPRLVLCASRASTITLHGFADASDRAYGCCIYVQSIDQVGRGSVHLLAAKSKVAPIRTSRPVACLELCAALLLSRLFAKMREIFPKPIDEEYLWTDSEIVLDWLANRAAEFKTYVRNRVSEIQELKGKARWRHVPSNKNPADIISRGIDAEELANSIWFSGPEFLQHPKDKWPSCKERHRTSDELPERRMVKSILVCAVSESFLETIYAVSNYSRNCRRFAYVLRFYKNLVAKRKGNSRVTGELLASETQEAFLRILWAIQQTSFSAEIKALERGDEVPRKSTIKGLAPFLEEVHPLNLKFLRVGGRLKLAELSADCRFPILLPRGNPFIKTYVQHLHRKNFHPGPLALVSILQRGFWVINARDYARKIVRNCLQCFRYRPRMAHQIMGDQPKGRVTMSLPFTHSGVDFCGPIMTTHRIRGKAPYKSYLAIFVCFATRAVHIEVVSDLTSEAFIGALKRFTGRRNLCRHLYCDNATNFVGAKRVLEELRKAIFAEHTQREIASWCSDNLIEFHPIPPRSPHFGGIWEAAVKSAKTHLIRSIQNSLLTFEELTTVMTQIEGILNSRPITPLSTDPNDFQALTPAHFLNQAPLQNILEPNYSIEKLNSLTRWQRVSALHQHFWRRWSKEYLCQLQQRVKWRSSCPNIQPGSMVLLQQDDSPPCKWKLGRITKTISGPDGHVRVVEVRTSSGSFQRAVHRVAPLPMED